MFVNPIILLNPECIKGSELENVSIGLSEELGDVSGESVNDSNREISVLITN